VLGALRRLHPRGRESRGAVLDADGAMLGPDCILVRRTPGGFRCVAPHEARAIQAIVLGPSDDPDLLFEQSQRIARALAKGETALAQICGLRIPLAVLDGAALRRLAAAARLTKADFDPDEPRIPAGEPGAGEWTYGDDGDADEPGVAPASASEDGGVGGGGGDQPSVDGEPPTDDETAPAIPAERPATLQARNTIVRRAAEWLRQAAALGAGFAEDPRAQAFLAALEAAAWIVEYLPEIRSYLDAPKSIEELQDAVANPQLGYQIHHIVEGQYNSTNEQSNAQRFPDQLESPENLVQIPTWKHVEISSWYSTRNDEYGGQTPRDYLRGKSWEEQHELGIKKLRDFEVLR
jgi:hypothetical protein